MNASSYVRSARSPTQAPATRACAGTCGEVCEVEVIHSDAVRVARAALPSPKEAERLTVLFGAFANTTRLAILVALRSVAERPKPELCVCDLVAVTRASQSMVSHQLGALRQSGLVTPRREGRLIYYRLAQGSLAALLDDALAFSRGGQP